MIRPFDFLMIGLVVVLSVVLYNVKYRAEGNERHVRVLLEEMDREEDAIRVLRAEWSFLNQPERIQKLAARHLALEPLQASQIATLDDLPMPPQQNDFYGPHGRRSLGGYAGVAPSDGKAVR